MIPAELIQKRRLYLENQLSVLWLSLSDIRRLVFQKMHYIQAYIIEVIPNKEPVHLGFPIRGNGVNDGQESCASQIKRRKT